MKLLPKILSGYLLVITIVIIIGAVLFWSLNSVIDAFDRIEYESEVDQKSQELEKLMLDMETGLRGYLITGNEEFLEPYNNAVERFDTLLEETKVLVSDDPEQVARLERISTLQQQWIEEAATPEIALRQQLNTATTTMSDILETVASGAGKTKTDEVRSELDAIQFNLDNNEVEGDSSLTLTVLLDVINMETSLRGYTLSGDKNFLDLFYEAQRQLSGDINALRVALRRDGDTESLNRLENIESIMDAWQTIAAEQITRRETYDQNPIELEDIAAMVSSGVGKNKTDAIRDEFTEFMRIESQQTAAVIEDSKETANTAQTLTLIVAIVGIVIGISLGFYNSRAISNRIGSITDDTRALTEGKLNQRSKVTGQDEVAVLASNFNTMADRLETMVSNEVTARKSLEDTVSNFMTFAEQVARGDLKNRLSARITEGDDPLARLGSNLNKMVDGLDEMTRNIQRAAEKEAAARKYLEDTVADYMAFVEKVAEGDLKNRLSIRSNNNDDPLIRLGSNLNKMVDGLDEMTRRVEQAAENERQARELLQATVDDYVTFVEGVAQGNLTQRLALKRNGNGRNYHEDQLTKLGDNLNRMVGGLSDMAGQTREVSLKIASATAEILAATTQQLASATEQDTSINQTSTTAKEVLATVTQTAERAENVAKVAQRSVEVSQQGQQAVKDSVDGMQMIRHQVEAIAENILALSEKTQQIGQIIASVNDIAEQSKVLALNASIEAARAGEEGKSFAVVAMEVRNLAEQSREATDQVREILNEIQQATNTAVMATEEGIKGVDTGQNLINRAGQTIQDLAGVIREASQSASQIAASTHQQTVGMDQLSAAMGAIRQASIQTTASVQQAERSAQDLNAMAKQMQEAVARYSL